MVLANGYGPRSRSTPLHPPTEAPDKKAVYPLYSLLSFRDLFSALLFAILPRVLCLYRIRYSLDANFLLLPFLFHRASGLMFFDGATAGASFAGWLAFLFGSEFYCGHFSYFGYCCLSWSCDPRPKPTSFQVDFFLSFPASIIRLGPGPIGAACVV